MTAAEECRLSGFVSPFQGWLQALPESRGTNLPVGARPWLLTAAPAGADVWLRRSLRLIPGTIPGTVGRSRCLEKLPSLRTSAPACRAGIGVAGTPPQGRQSFPSVNDAQNAGTRHADGGLRECHEWCS